MSFDPNTQPAQRQRGMESFDIVLVAGVPGRMPLNGDYIHILSAPVADLRVRFDNGKPVKVFEGLGFRRYYSDVEFESATGQTITVLLGFGSVADARATVNASITANIQYGNTLTNPGDVACAAGAATLLSAITTTRLYAIINNPSANTGTFRIGASSVTASSGLAVEPGESVTVTGSEALYAWNTGAGSESLNMIFVGQV